MSKTRIDFGILGPGFFYLPEHTILYCPECGERVREKGEAVCSIIYDVSSSGGFKLAITRCKCGAFNINPVGIKPINNNVLEGGQNDRTNDKT